MRFQRGQTITAEVIEIQKDGHLLVAINDEYLLVRNTTAKVFKPFSRVRLEVVGVYPLELRLVARDREALDRFI